LPASQITDGATYHLFVQGIKPMWEDAENKNGGKWQGIINNTKFRSRMAKLWLDTVRVFLFYYCLVYSGVLRLIAVGRRS
jgi:hypothetical protein